MKRWVLTGALAALACGGTAFAQNQSSTDQTAPCVQVTPCQNKAAEPGMGGSGMENPQSAAPLAEPPVSPEQQPVLTPPPPAPAPVSAPLPRYENRRGMVSITAGAGVDGFFDNNSSLLYPGFSWGATLSGHPTRALGFEVGYSGAVHEIHSEALTQGLAYGADIVRNGADVAVTLGPPWKVQPYVLGGYGLNWYTAREATQALGFQNDVGGAIPLGAGIRTNFGPFAADARFDYNLGIGEQFSPVGGANADRYEAQLQIGANF